MTSEVRYKRTPTPEKFSPLYLLPRISILFPGSRADGEWGGKAAILFAWFLSDCYRPPQLSSCFLVTPCEPEHLGSMIGALRSMLMKPGYHWYRNNEVGSPPPPRTGFWSSQYCLIKAFSLAVLRSIFSLQLYTFKDAYNYDGSPTIRILKLRAWRDGSVFQSACYPSRGLEFYPQYLHHMAPRDLTPSFGGHRHP